MNALSKILALILVVLAIAAVLFSLKAVARFDSDRRVVASMKGALEKDADALAHLRGILGLGKEKITALRGEKQAVTDQLLQMTSAKESLEKDLGQARQDIVQLQAQVKMSNESLEAERKKVADTEAKVTQLEQKQKELETTLESERQQTAKSNAELMEIKSVIAANPEFWARMISPEKVLGEAPKEMEILNVKSYGVNIVAFNGAGAVNKGDTFAVLRDGKHVGKMSLGDIYCTVLVCQAKGDKVEAKLQKGDKLLSQAK